MPGGAGRTPRFASGDHEPRGSPDGAASPGRLWSTGQPPTLPCSASGFVWGGEPAVLVENI